MDLFKRNASGITVLTGTRGAGKTTACEAMIQSARASGQRPVGILQPGRFSAAGEKVGFDLIDLATNTRRIAGNSDVLPNLGTQLGKWTVDAAVFAWADGILARLASEAAKIDLLILDELGPLEFDQGQGMVHAFDLLRLGNAARAVVVIRPEKVDDFRALGFDFILKTIPEPKEN